MICLYINYIYHTYTHISKYFRNENVVRVVGERAEVMNLLFPVDLKHVKAATKIQVIAVVFRYSIVF